MNVWVGNFGEYEIPTHLQDVKITRNGWPDRRCKRYAEFMDWVKSVDVQKS